MKPHETPNSGELRQRAEARLKGKLAASPPPTAGELRRLNHELAVHEIELEMQNEELRLAQEAMLLALGKYTDLYDFAPTGYFTFARDGSILAVNLPGARLAGATRVQLLRRRFDQLLPLADWSVFAPF